MKSENRFSSQHEERLDLLVEGGDGRTTTDETSRRKRRVSQTALRRLFLGPSPRRQSGKAVKTPESRRAIVVTRQTLARAAPLTQTFSTPFNRL